MIVPTYVLYMNKIYLEKGTSALVPYQHTLSMMGWWEDLFGLSNQPWVVERMYLVVEVIRVFLTRHTTPSLQRHLL